MKKKYTTNIDEELLKEAKIKAIQENINLNDLIERLLREYLKWGDYMLAYLAFFISCLLFLIMCLWIAFLIFLLKMQDDINK